MIKYLLLLTACSLNNTEQNTSFNGKELYKRHCLVCHGVDPSKGASGPDIYGSSRELILTKVRYQSYPDGYTPKRNTKIMPKFTQLSDEDIEKLYQYLNSE